MGGTDYNDFIRAGIADDDIGGGRGNDILDGGAGADVIDGGTGIDMLRFDSSDSGITFNQRTGTGSGGDAQGDTYTNIEGSFGTDENDTFIIDYHSGGKFAGGDGTDTFDLTITPAEANSGEAFAFENDAGVEILWGGPGGEKDIYKLDEYAQIAVVQIDNLTEEQFATLTYDDLGLNDLPYKPSVVLINPDANDEIILSSLTTPLNSDNNDYSGTYDRTLNITDNRVASTLAELGLSGARDYYSYEASNGHGGAEEILQLGWVWSETRTIDGRSLEVFGNLTNIDGIPGPDTDGLIPSDAYSEAQTWSMIGAEIHGTSIYLSKGTTLKVNLGSDDDDDQNGSDDDENFNGSDGADSINGQGGRDTVNYAQSTAGATIDLANDFAAGGFADGDTLTNIENIRGSEFNDILTGDEQSNTLSGGGGADTLDGGSGDDILNGGNGNDTLEGGSGFDLYTGGDGADIFVIGSAGSDVITDFTSGTDKIDLSLISDSTQFTFSDVIASLQQVTWDTGGVFDTSGSDDLLLSLPNGTQLVILNVSPGDLTEDDFLGLSVELTPNGQIDGTDGDDTFRSSTHLDVDGEAVGNGNDLVYGYGGDDSFYTFGGNDTAYGGDGNDTLHANFGYNRFYGEAGNDTIEVGLNAGLMDGGEGDDVLLFRLTHFANGGTYIATGGAGADVFNFYQQTDDATGQAVVTDFELGVDELQILGETIDLQNLPSGYQSTVDGDDLILQIGDDDFITFENLTLV
ncbi:calcium-binding protein [Thalassobius sp. I31.1]|uniref:calcium-binding protein n=1 Tax=Thalassobius sp. I31.1 TaxID=2109912 RepID=UPI001E4E1D15|nr:calcium-binding protein [Thalassobius sp. I31.1]